MKNSFVMYTDYSTHIQLLSREQRGDLLTAIMAYASGEELPEIDGMTMMAFSFIKMQMDRDNERYEKTVEARREAGRKGGKSKANASGNEQKEPKVANAIFGKQKVSNQADNDTVTDNDTENVNENKKYTCAFEELWKAYPRKKEKAGAYKSYKARLADGFSEDELMTAVKRYADECQKEKTEQKYIKHASTFLGPSTPFTDYLKEADNDTDGEAGTDEKGYISQLIEQGYDPGEFHGF